MKNQIIENAKHILSSEKEAILIEHGFNSEKKSAVYLSKKTPLYDVDKKLAGIIGLSIDVTEKSVRSFSESIIPEIKREFIIDSSVVKLSLRQQQCLNYLLCGLTAKEIANRLNVSVRTVEQHISATKLKFKCTKKSELINKILSLSSAAITDSPSSQ